MCRYRISPILPRLVSLASILLHHCRNAHGVRIAARLLEVVHVVGGHVTSIWTIDQQCGGDNESEGYESLFLGTEAGGGGLEATSQHCTHAACRCIGAQAGKRYVSRHSNSFRSRKMDECSEPHLAMMRHGCLFHRDAVPALDGDGDVISAWTEATMAYADRAMTSLASLRRRTLDTRAVDTRTAWGAVEALHEDLCALVSRLRLPTNVSPYCCVAEVLVFMVLSHRAPHRIVQVVRRVAARSGVPLCYCRHVRGRASPGVRFGPMDGHYPARLSGSSNAR